MKKICRSSLSELSFHFPIRKPLQWCIHKNSVQCNNGSFYWTDIPMVSAVLGACQDVAGPRNRQPFPPRARWLTKTQQAGEPERPAAPLPSTLGYSAIPILNKSIEQLEIESRIGFSFNEHLQCSSLISRVTSYHHCVYLTGSRKNAFYDCGCYAKADVKSVDGRFTLW